MPKVEVVNGVELKMDGVSCRLFGVSLPQNDEVANKAKRFLKMNTYSLVFSRPGLDETGHVWFHRNQTYSCKFYRTDRRQFD